MNEWVGRSLRLTTVCLAASALLIPPGFAGVGPSLPFVLGLGILAAGLLAVRDQLASLPTAVGYDLGWYARDLWLAAALAALVTIVGPATTADELAALGGVVGLVGMLNYFVRPLYLLVFSLVVRSSRSSRG